MIVYHLMGGSPPLFVFYLELIPNRCPGSSRERCQIPVTSQGVVNLHWEVRTITSFPRLPSFVRRPVHLRQFVHQQKGSGGVLRSRRGKESYSEGPGHLFDIESRLERSMFLSAIKVTISHFTYTNPRLGLYSPCSTAFKYSQSRGCMKAARSSGTSRHYQGGENSSSQGTRRW